MGTEILAVTFTILFTIATSRLLGRYMFQVFTGGRTLLDPVLVPVERLVLRLTGVDPERAAGLEAVLALAADLERVHVAGDLDDRHAAAVPAAQSRRHRQHGADARVQHDLELHDEHEPAALQRRDRAVVLLADVHDLASCSSSRRRPAWRRRGDHARARRQPSEDARQLLRRSDARDRFASSCHWRFWSRSF